MLGIIRKAYVPVLMDRLVWVTKIEKRQDSCWIVLIKDDGSDGGCGTFLLKSIELLPETNRTYSFVLKR